MASTLAVSLHHPRINQASPYEGHMEPGQKKRQGCLKLKAPTQAWMHHISKGETDTLAARVEPCDKPIARSLALPGGERRPQCRRAASHGGVNTPSGDTAREYLPLPRRTNRGQAYRPTEPRSLPTVQQKGDTRTLAAVRPGTWEKAKQTLGYSKSTQNPSSICLLTSNT